ncbi:MAG TPA: tRNA (adenosine(37)-N6)-threonylcarbamoyltransferase complex ATPase subunit type 1 TsaE [Clostridiales bacterium]|nr:tRNA (adenosine(37)-N6)-threonylcarbamoyltransferase complex ATPase subunit type 1 TsaE [Clostridiales bacterium]
MIYRTNSQTETARLAKEFAKSLKPGDVIALYGGLGAGKTAFVRGLAEGLGLDPREVSSPTFALINEYPGRNITLCHFDMYRVEGEDSLESTGYFDYLSRKDCILAVEWSENIEEHLPPRHIVVMIRKGEQENQRIIEIQERVNNP